MPTNHILYPLKDIDPYIGLEGWLNRYFRDDLQNQDRWIFLYSQQFIVEESIFLYYDNQIRIELDIEGYVKEDEDSFFLVEEYKNLRGLKKARGYKVNILRIFEDSELLTLDNLNIILEGHYNPLSSEKVEEIREIIGNNYEEISKS